MIQNVKDSGNESSSVELSNAIPKLNSNKSSRKPSIHTQAKDYEVVLNTPRDNQYKQHNVSYLQRIIIGTILMIGSWIVPITWISLACSIIWISFVIKTLLECDQSVIKNALFFDFEVYYKLANVCSSMIAYHIVTKWQLSNFWHSDKDEPWILYTNCIIVTIGNMLVVLLVAVLDGYNIKRGYKIGLMLVVIGYHSYIIILVNFSQSSNNVYDTIDLSLIFVDTEYLIDWSSTCISTGFALIIFLCKQLYFVIMKPNQCAFAKMYVPIHIIPYSRNYSYNYNYNYNYNSNDDTNTRLLSSSMHMGMLNNNCKKSTVSSNVSHKIDDIAKVLYKYGDQYGYNGKRTLAYDAHMYRSNLIAITSDDYNYNYNTKQDDDINDDEEIYVNVYEADTLWYHFIFGIMGYCNLSDDNNNNYNNNDNYNFAFVNKYGLNVSIFFSKRHWIFYLLILIIAIHIFVSVKWMYSWTPLISVQFIELLIALLCVITTFGMINMEILKYQLKTSFSMYWMLFQFTMLQIIPIVTHYDGKSSYIYNTSVFKQTWQVVLVWIINFIGVNIVVIQLSSIKGYLNYSKYARRFCLVVAAGFALYQGIDFLKVSNSPLHVYASIWFMDNKYKINVLQIGAHKCFDLFIWWISRIIEEFLRPHKLPIERLSKKWI